MKNKYTKYLLSTASVLFGIVYATDSVAISTSSAYNLLVKNSYNENTRLSNAELELLRGGFFTAGGLKIDFGITSRTVIDGDIKSQVQYNTAAIANLNKSIRNDVQDSVSGALNIDIDPEITPPSVEIIEPNFGVDESVPKPAVLPVPSRAASTATDSIVKNIPVAGVDPKLSAPVSTVPVLTVPIDTPASDIENYIDVPAPQVAELPKINIAPVDIAKAKIPSAISAGKTPENNVQDKIVEVADAQNIAPSPAINAQDGLQVSKDATGLNTNVQIGNNSQFSGINNFSGISTIIRNSVDNKVIQQSNIVDIVINDIANYHTQFDLNILRDQNIIALK